MKNTFKLLAVAANIYLLQLILPDVGGIMQANPLLWLFAGAAGSKLLDSDSPKAVTRDPGAEHESAIQTQLKYQPQIYAADQYYTPLYADLELSNLERTLFGSTGGAGVPLADTPGQASAGAGPLASEYDAALAALGPRPAGAPASRNRLPYRGSMGAGADQAVWDEKFAELEKQNLSRVPRQPAAGPAAGAAPGGGQAGILDLMGRAQPQIDEITRRSTAYQREGDVRDVEALGGRATAAFRESAGTTGLLDKLRTQAEEGLTGDILDPRLRREFTQATRAGQRDRGFGYGARDIAEESAFTAMQADALRRQRQNFAQSVVGTLQATSVDPFQAILNRPGQAMAAGQGAFGQANLTQGGAGPSGMFGMNPYFAGVGDYNANARNAANIGQYNAQMGLLGGMIQGGASLAGAYGMGRMSQNKPFLPGW